MADIAQKKLQGELEKFKAVQKGMSNGIVFWNISRNYSYNVHYNNFSRFHVQSAFILGGHVGCGWMLNSTVLSL